MPKVEHRPRGANRLDLTERGRRRSAGVSGGRWAPLAVSLLLVAAILLIAPSGSAAHTGEPRLLTIEEDAQPSRHAASPKQGAQPKSSTRVTCEEAGDDFAILCAAFSMATQAFLEEVQVDKLAAQALVGVQNAGLAERTEGTPPPCALPAPQFEAMCAEIDEVADTAAAARAAADQMLVSLDDPQTYLMTPDEYVEYLARLDSNDPRIGLGVDYALLDDGEPCTEVSASCRPVIVEVYSGSPAAAAGLLVGDVLVSLDATLPSNLACDTVGDLDHGLTSGDEVDVSVLRAGTAYDYRITVASVEAPFVRSQIVDGNIGYISLSIFAIGSSAEFGSHLRNLVNAGIAAVVVDLRDNPGGRVDETLAIAGLFLKRDQVTFQYYRREGQAFTIRTTSNGLASNAVALPLAVAVNGGSASGSEAFSLAMRGNHRGLLVGAATYGKDTGQQSRAVRAADDTLLAGIRMTTLRFSGPGGLSSAGGMPPDAQMSLPECLHPIGVARRAVVPLYPKVASVRISSTPAGAAYTTGEKITAAVALDRPVEVDTASGTPYISLQVGASTRQAAYTSTATQDGTSVLTFEYTAANDTDFDGISIAADSVEPNGGTIRHNAGWDAVLEHDAVPADPNQLVGPSLTVADIAVDEDDSTATFTVTLSPRTASTVTVHYATRDGTATGGAGQDFAHAAATLTFSADETSKAVAVTLSDDTVDEFDETFDLVLSGASNALIGRAVATATIADNDPQPRLSISAGTADEGSPVRYTVSLSHASALPVEVDVATADGSAVAGDDYRPVSRRLVIAAGQRSSTLTVATTDDELDEDDEETFVLSLSNSLNAVIAAASSTAFILDDDPLPSVSVSGGFAAENGNLDFVVTMTSASSRMVRIDYELAGLSATAGADFDSASGSVQIAPGKLSATVSVAVFADGLEEPEESFRIALTAARHASIGTAAAIGRIEDVDGSSEDDDGGGSRVGAAGGSGGGGADLDVGVAVLVVANGRSAADVGAASVLAARTAGAVVVYTAGDVLSEPAHRLISDVLPAEVIIVGGTSAVTRKVRAGIRAASSGSDIGRISGADRVDTSVQAARRVLGAPSETGPVTLVIANGWSPSDIGTAAALAARTPRSAVLYTRHEVLGDSAVSLLRDYQPARIVIVGGVAAVSAAVEAEAGIAAADATVLRLAGTDRVDTATAAARRVLGDPSGIADGVVLVIANGWSPPDIGAAAAFAAKTSNAAVAYTAAGALPAATAALIVDYAPADVVIIGGRAAVTDDVRDAIAAAAPDARVRRISGATREHTAATAARRILANP